MLRERLRRRLGREARELSRLWSMTRGVPGSASLVPPGIAFIDGPSTAAQFRTIFMREAYRFESHNSEPRILDCGANIGMASIYWKRLFPKSRILAFEPDLTIAGVLRSNLISCGASDVEAVQAAVWVATGQVRFRHEGGDAGRIPEAGVVGHDATPVPCVRLRDYLQEPVDFLKLDIEGAEVDVLLDCSDRLAAVQQLYIEYHRWSNHPQRLDELLALISRIGFGVYLETEHREVARPFVGDEPSSRDLRVGIYASRLGADG
jgi:FkbM family methyltransferase